jgi:hypothetical protein
MTVLGYAQVVLATFARATELVPPTAHVCAPLDGPAAMAPPWLARPTSPQIPTTAGVAARFAAIRSHIHNINIHIVGVFAKLPRCAVSRLRRFRVQHRSS